jgi:hypothetical protein
MQAVGPIIPVPEAPDHIRDAYEALSLQRLYPRFTEFPKEAKTLLVTSKIPDPETVDSSSPEIISLIFEIPGTEPEVAFPEFVRGAAVVAAMVPAEVLTAVKAALLEVAERVIGGGELPSIDIQFVTEVREIERAIISNGETVSWRPLLAFMCGAFWLLSFVDAPKRRRGRFSPIEFVDFRLTLSAQLGYTPK